MKTLSILFSALIFSGCAIFPRLSNHGYAVRELKTIVNRLALIDTKDDVMGSAVNIGNGYFISARHIIIRDTSYAKFRIASEEGEDDNPIVVGDTNDVVLIKTSIKSKIKPIKIGVPLVGEKVVWMQMFFYPNDQVTFFLNSGHISRVEYIDIYINEPFLPGMSGTGIFNLRGGAYWFGK